MSTTLRIATFNLENLDDEADRSPSLEERIPVLRPQLDRIRADVLCLQEVNGQEPPGQPRRLLALERLLDGTVYDTYHVSSTLTQNDEVYDVRNLVVVSRFPVLERRQIKHQYAPGPAYRKVTADPADDEASDVSWERPLLYLTLDLGGGRVLHLVNLHFKSKRPTHIDGQKRSRWEWKSAAGWAEGAFMSAMKRVGQALETRILVDRLFDEAEAAGGERPFIALCGDFNAESHEIPVRALRGPVEETGNPDLVERVLVPYEHDIAEPSRFSLLHLGRGEMIDHILVSRALLAHFRGAEVHNEVLPDESGAFRTDVQFPESDHAPVVAHFELG